MSRWLWLAAMLCAMACGSTHMDFDSKSNWLRDCSSQDDCGDDLSCLCGVCTKRCERASACEGDKNVCVDPSRDGIESSCASDPQADAPGICLLACLSSSECDGGQRCMAGACVNRDALDDRPDSGQA